MILRLILQNFLSFDDEVQFDMFPNMKRTSLSSHIYTFKEQVAVLKMAAVYGGNGAGKSNLLKGIDFLKELATNKSFLNSSTVGKYFYALKPNVAAEPISLTVEFVTSAQEPYLYTVEVGMDGIVSESLYVSSLGHGAYLPVYRRTPEGVEYNQPNSSEVEEIVNGWMKQNPFASLLTINNDMPILKDDRINKAQRWFLDELEIIGIHSFSPALITLFKNNPSLNDFATHLFQEISLGIDRVKVETENFEDWSSSHDVSGLPVDQVRGLRQGVLSEVVNFRNTRAISVDEGVKKISQMLFEQFGKNGYVREMDINAQSDGTVRLLSLVPAIYGAFKEGKTVVIDEIDHSIHPSLIRELIRFFSHSETNGQLIFTTHQTCLMNQEFIRTDEVWLAEKKEGSTLLYSLNDFKIHNTINVANGYMEGRYGAIPFIGELNF
jgi:hypothetical protein